ncbi:hypothetical protein DUI87_11089 [Hirundo rustica rustica]|uniref:Uncharacterized protein n=1 Tax=Hirundo rustica rustica TaxID=333673 RepID=A0A3M0KFF4_HIRRU|nr:hypothetical protein DUI87_11089 [Hirundo rustica rustica]
MHEDWLTSGSKPVLFCMCLQQEELAVVAVKLLGWMNQWFELVSIIFNSVIIDLSSALSMKSKKTSFNGEDKGQRNRGVNVAEQGQQCPWRFLVALFACLAAASAKTNLRDTFLPGRFISPCTKQLIKGSVAEKFSIGQRLRFIPHENIKAHWKLQKSSLEANSVMR